eukprot:TRINITY_DN4094_c0_g1_i2.p1 TRINITY_DN4094_c0_g1~~TRINITY_DN4094_c0_g1_i2.p1  ORF type:complete len:220 (+),score=79.30 TRINITY_DN4094_c0_g1_i2:139-798(+)
MERKRGLTPKADSEDENSQSESEFECELVEAEECETIVELPKKKNSRKSSYQKIQEEANKKINKNGTLRKTRKELSDEARQKRDEILEKGRQKRRENLARKKQEKLEKQKEQYEQSAKEAVQETLKKRQKRKQVDDTYNKKRKDYDEQVKQLIQETMIKQMREALRGSYDEDEDDEPAKKQSKARKQPQKFEVIKEEFLDEEPQLIDWDNRYMPYYGKR